MQGKNGELRKIEIIGFIVWATDVIVEDSLLRIYLNNIRIIVKTSEMRPMGLSRGMFEAWQI
jgi:hypothetical protein